MLRTRLILSGGSLVEGLGECTMQLHGPTSEMKGHEAPRAPYLLDNGYVMEAACLNA
jgi:hypothetical protein